MTEKFSYPSIHNVIEYNESKQLAIVLDVLVRSSIDGLNIASLTGSRTRLFSFLEIFDIRFD